MLTMIDDPLERRRAQRERAKRRNLSLAIVLGGLLVTGLVVAVVAFGGRGKPIDQSVPVTSDEQFTPGAIVTVEGEVTIVSASAGGNGRSSRVIVLMDRPGRKSITCAFLPEAYDERWHHDTRRGDTMKVTGRVDEVYERSVRLADCKFISQTLRK